MALLLLPPLLPWLLGVYYSHRLVFLVAMTVIITVVCPSVRRFPLFYCTLERTLELLRVL